MSGPLRLSQLILEAKQAFYDFKLTVAHAFEVARLQPNDQRRALQECFPHLGMREPSVGRALQCRSRCVLASKVLREPMARLEFCAIAECCELMQRYL